MSHPNITGRKLPDRQVRERYGVCSRTLARWDGNSELDFPKPTIINGRKYRDEDELTAWDQAQAAKADLSSKKQKPINAVRPCLTESSQKSETSAKSKGTP